MQKLFWFESAVTEIFLRGESGISELLCFWTFCGRIVNAFPNHKSSCYEGAEVTHYTMGEVDGEHHNIYYIMGEVTSEDQNVSIYSTSWSRIIISINFIFLGKL